MRLETAIDASRAWYEDVFDLHGTPARAEDGLWIAGGEPPRWHSAAKTLRPDVTVERVVRAVATFAHCAVADSYGTLDLTEAGFRPLFRASWLFRPPHPGLPQPWPQGWSVLTREAELTSWNAAHDTEGVLTPPLLQHPRFTFLGRRSGESMVAGGVLHVVGEAIELSNSWSTEDAAGDIASLLACADVLFPGHAMTGYAHGSELVHLRNVGFRPVGPHVVWVR